MSIMKVILEKIIHFLCYGISNMTSRWLLRLPIIKERRSSPLKYKIYTKSPIQLPHPDTCSFCYMGGSHLGFTQNGVLRCANFEPHDFIIVFPYRDDIHPNRIWGFKSRQPHLDDMPASTSDCTHKRSCKWPEARHLAICNHTNGKQTYYRYW